MEERRQRVTDDRKSAEQHPRERLNKLRKIESAMAGTEEEAHEAPLPFHLILGRLPVKQIFQLPCVCKHWNLMLGAGEVLLDSKSAGEEYWFVMSKPPPRYGRRVWDFMAFSSHSSSLSEMKDWPFFRLPLPSQSHSKLLSLLGGVRCTLLPFHNIYWDVMKPCMVSAGGLMCAILEKSGAPNDYHVIVFNLLTGSVKVLPPVLDRPILCPSPLLCSLPYICPIYMGFDVQDPDRYYILLMRVDTFQYFEVFDSRSGCWKVGRNPKSATANFKVVDGDFFHEENSISTLFAYHVADDVWSKVWVPNIEKEDLGMAPTFHKYNGRLLRGVVLMQEIFMTRVWLGFVVFELQPATSEAATWVEVARTPQHLWQRLNSLDWTVVVKAEGSLFYMKIKNLMGLGRFRPPLVYDMTQNTWYVLPSGTGSTNYGCVFVHRPRLSMLRP